MLLKGVGLAGIDEICRHPDGDLVGLQQLKLRGYVTYNPAVALRLPSTTNSQTYYALLTVLPYWFVANGRRIVVVVKTGTYYECVHLGCPAGCHAGSMPVSPGGGWLVQRFDALGNAYTYRNHLPRSGGLFRAYWSPTGTWNSSPAYFWPGTWGSNQR